MEEIIFGLIVLGIIGLICLPFIMKGEKKTQIYQSYPTVDEYLDRYFPNVQERKGITCYKCGSNQIWSQRQDYGAIYDHLNEAGFLLQCHQCHTWLYRTGGSTTVSSKDTATNTDDWAG
jgi:hypothetical protein